MACGCGRSPTGKCIGWHALTEEQYKQKLAEYRERETKEHGGPQRCRTQHATILGKATEK